MKLFDEIIDKYLILNNINDFIFILNNDLLFEYFNEEVVNKQLNYRENELIGTNFKDYIHKEDIINFTNFLENKFKSKHDKEEIRIRNKNGNYHWFEYIGKSYFNKSGDLKYLIILQNISQRKNIEERYKILFENSPNAIILIDFNGIIVDINSSTIKLFGFKREDLIGKSIYELQDLFSLNMKPFYKKIFDASFKGEVPESIELKVKDKTEKYVWINVQASLIKIEERIYIQFIFQDITEKKKVELLEKQFKEQLEIEVTERTRELNKTLEEQKYYLDQILKSSQFKTEFMATMSHELRTPLNAMIGFTDLLLEGVYGQLNTEQLEFIKDIKSSAEHQFEMIKNILDISKIEAGQITLNYQRFSLNSIVDQINATLKPLCEKKGLEFKIKGIEKELELLADPIRFKEILFNLLDNAVKYSIKGQIILDVIEKYDHWLFKVKDEGIGIAQKDHNLIFKEFKRINSPFVQSVSGSGLGLSLTKRLVNLHGGEITFFSVEGVGTTFTFTIPKKDIEKII